MAFSQVEKKTILKLKSWVGVQEARINPIQPKTTNLSWMEAVLQKILDSNMENVSPQQYYRAYSNDLTMKKDVEPCTFKELFRFADRKDVILMIIGTIFSLANGVSLIFYALPFGQLVDAFAPNRDPQDIVDDALESVKLFLINSAVVFVNSWFMSAAWTITSERQMIRARKAYFESLMEQEVAWHDRNRPAEVCSKMYIEISKVHQGLVNNVTSVLTKISMGISGVLIALINGWQMALVMIAFLPIMMLSGILSSRYLKKIQKYQQKTKARFDSDVIQVFDSIRTVRMLDGEEYETKRYQSKLVKSQQENTHNGIKNKLSFAVFFFCILMNYSLGFWYGAKLVSEQTHNSSTGQAYSVKDVIIIFFTLYMSNLSLSGLPESITNFNISRISMKRVCYMVDRPCRVEDGTIAAPKNISAINFQQVLFQYDKPLFKNFDFKLQQGMTALIGESGSGKTTIISLIMRFYDVFGGKIFLQSGGQKYDLSKLTNESLRDRIGYVGQQPVLIGKTLKEALTAENVPEDQVISLLKMVKAWDFVKDIGLDSEYAMLSGGQKQRIAIARALIKKPQILILDQGTSALDRTTEQKVLDSIKKLKIPFVIMIAHRMETVVHCDCIVKLDKGKIVACGNYNELVAEGVLADISLKLNGNQEERDPMKETGLNLKQEKEKEIILKKIQSEQQAQGQENSEEDEEEQKEEKEFHMSYICRLMRSNSKLWYLYLIGIVGSLFIGAIFPTFAYLLSNIIVTLTGVKYAKDQRELEGYQEEVKALSLSLFMISIGSLLIVALRGVSFTHLTETLGYYLKKKAFKTSINKPMVELDEYGPQQYAHIVTTNCEDLKHLGGHHIGDILENATTVIVGLAIAFAFSWQITLISLAVFPLIILSGKLQMAFNHGMQSNTDKVHKKTHENVIESIMFIKTVKSLDLQKRISAKYSQALEEALSMAVRYGNLSGIMFGVGQTLISCLLALIFFFGALLIKEGVVNVLNLYTSIYAIMFAGVQAGGNLYFLSRLSAAKYAACNYFQKVQSEIENLEHSVYIANNRIAGDDEPMKRIKGQIELNDIEFKYANRDTPIFKHFSLRIKKGQKVALVGESGSGKSTITNLIFRIYEPASGQILIDGSNINNYSLSHLRRQLGIVSQEPVLFNRSVYENIKYNSKNATFQDVVTASKMAKAYDFICQGNFGMNEEDELEEEISEFGQDNGLHSEEKIEKAKSEDKITIDAFKKKVGTRGSYLSGGQKQRIAIARALIRNPSVMVLDEATSALDNQNQKMVQQAIESIHGTTQIVIAHRLSTIENSDKIVMMKRGNIVEEGRYNQLLKKGGYFYKLVNAIKQNDELSVVEQSILKQD